jgi:periplasmic protein TonB
MSEVPQFRALDIDPSSAAGDELTALAPPLERDNPLQLLREAIDRLNSSAGDLPDQTQVANLLTEARQALERTNAIARVVTQCREFLKESQFKKALEAIDTGLIAYPGDPALVKQRSEMEARQKAFDSAAAVSSAIGEAKWLMDQDRPDLAAQFLKEQAARLADQQALVSRLEEIEALLPQWEQGRRVRVALEQAAAVERLEQWQTALTIVEQARQSYPTSAELIRGAARIRDRLADDERKKKLARRIELVRQKISSKAWTQALTLLDNTEKEFPDSPGLTDLWCEANTGLRRSECEAVAAEVRQCLADGEPDQAMQALRKGLESLGHEPALDALAEELESDRSYREGLQTAQVLFAQRRLPEAEQVLLGMALQDRPEAQALLDVVRRARAASEEENFCERGREKALKLMQQHHFAQAADLLRNLLSLFPGNPILERDLRAAQLGQGPPEVPPAAAVETLDAEATSGSNPGPLGPMAPDGRAVSPIGGTTRVRPNLRFRQAAMVYTASAVLVSVSGATWNHYRQAPASKISKPAAATSPAGAPLPITPQANALVATPPSKALETPPRQPSPEPPATIRTDPVERKTPSSQALRPFIPPATNRMVAPVQSSELPLPVAGTAVSMSTTPSLPAELAKPINISPPPPAAPRQQSAPAAPPPNQAPVSTGGRIQEATLIRRVSPEYPGLARDQFRAGVVRLEAAIDEHGTVAAVKVLSGNPVFAEAAKKAVLQWKYNPALLNGKPIPSEATITVTFGDRK